MKKSDYCFKARMMVVFMVIIGVLLSFVLQSQAQTRKAYVSAQDGTKVFVFDLSQNNLIKTIDIYTPTPLGKVLPPNINDILAVGQKIFMTVPGAEISAAGRNEVKVIDARSDTIVATLKTDMTPSGLLAYQGKIYIVNRYGNTIQEMDPDTMQIVRSIPFSAPGPLAMNHPLFMEIAHDKIYLPFPGALSRPGGIQILSLKTGEMLKFIDFSTISNYGPMAIKKVGEDKIYLGGAQSVAVLDTRQDQITKTIKLSGREVYVQAFMLNAGKVYAANGVSTVSVIDPRNDTLINEIDVGFHSYACHLKAGIAASTNQILIADAGRGLKIIDATKGKLVLTVASQEPLGAMAIIPEKAD